MSLFEVGDRAKFKSGGNDEFEILATDGPDVWVKSSAGWRFTKSASDMIKVEPKWEVGKSYRYSSNGPVIVVRWVSTEGAAVVTFDDAAGRLASYVKPQSTRAQYKEVEDV